LYERKRNGAAACTRNVFCAREIAWLSSAIIHHQGPLAPAFVRSVRCDIRSQRCTRSGGANRLWWRGRPWRTRGEERGGRRGPEKRVHEWRRGMRSCLLVPVRFRKRRRAGGGVIGPATWLGRPPASSFLLSSLPDDSARLATSPSLESSVNLSGLLRCRDTVTDVENTLNTRARSHALFIECCELWHQCFPSWSIRVRERKISALLGWNSPGRHWPHTRMNGRKETEDPEYFPPSLLWRHHSPVWVNSGRSSWPLSASGKLRRRTQRCWCHRSRSHRRRLESAGLSLDVDLLRFVTAADVWCVPYIRRTWFLLQQCFLPSIYPTFGGNWRAPLARFLQWMRALQSMCDPPRALCCNP
jgi:hypothetical protein